MTNDWILDLHHFKCLQIDSLFVLYSYIVSLTLGLLWLIEISSNLIEHAGVASPLFLFKGRLGIAPHNTSARCLKVESDFISPEGNIYVFDILIYFFTFFVGISPFFCLSTSSLTTSRVGHCDRREEHFAYVMGHIKQLYETTSCQALARNGFLPGRIDYLWQKTLCACSTLRFLLQKLCLCPMHWRDRFAYPGMCREFS